NQKDSRPPARSIAACSSACATTAPHANGRLALFWRPAVNLLQAAAHQLLAIAIREPVGDAKRLHALLVGQQIDGAGPVGTPQAAVERESIEDARQRIPDVLVRKLLMAERAGAADLDRHVLVFGELEDFRQLLPRLPRRRRLERLLEAEMIENDLRIGIALGELAKLLQAVARQHV